MTATSEMTETEPATGGRNAVSFSRSVAFCIVLFSLASLIPVLSVRFPPMTDYASHYVRLWLMTGAIENPQLSAFYAVDWNVAWTNIAIDLIAVALGNVASMNFIGPFVMALGLLMAPIGVTLLNRRLFGGFHWWQLLCFILAWNSVYLFGFLSYSISLGLALIFAYVDDCLKDRGKAMLFGTRALCAAIMLVAHPFGLLFYTALLAALQFGPSWAPLRERKAFLAATGRVLIAVAPVFVPLIALLLFGPPLPGEDNGASILEGMRWFNPSPLRSLMLLFTYFRTYDFRLDIVYVLLLFVIVRETARRGMLQVHWGLILVAIVTGLLSTIMPTQAFDTGSIDNRLPCMMALAAVVGVRPNVAGRLQSAVLPLVLLVVASRIAFVEYVWVARSADVRSVETVLQHVPPGSAVLPLQHDIIADNMLAAPVGRNVGGIYKSYLHYPALAILERQAFMPYLFTGAGKQPLRVKEPWKDISVPEGMPVPVHMLNDEIYEVAPYMRDWNNRFDYILVMNADMPNPGGPMPAVPNVHLIADQGFAQLYKIDHARPSRP